MPKNLLEDEDAPEVELKVNKSYADTYDTWRRKEELQKFKDRYGKDALDGSEENSTTSSSDEDTDAEVNEVFDKEFYHTLSCLKAKDPKIYDKDTKFFETVDKVTESGEKKPSGKTKPLYLRDYERKLILEKGGILSDEDDLEINDEEEEKIHSPSYFEEQEAIRKSFKMALEENQKDEGNEESSIGGLFSKKIKSSEEKEKEADEYAEWLQGRKDELENEEEAEGLSVLRSYWSDPSLDAGEAFLRDYILQKKFTTKGKEKRIKKERSPVESDNDSLEGEEKDIKKMEEFEHKYNFRFEEPDQEFIKQYPRTLETTLRRKDDKRKEKRKDLKTRKEAEMQKQKEELRKAKEFKRKEIEERLQQLCSITGNPEIGFKGEDLEEDFDPEEHDRRMNELFSQNTFYTAAEDEKPDFPSIDEELDIEEWDNWDEAEEENETIKLDKSNPNLHSGDPDFIMDCEYEAEGNSTMEKTPQGRKAKRERGRRRRGLNSKLAKGLGKEKPLFDPISFLSKNPQAKQSEAFEKYVDEYYGLDFEDVIGGDLPCRFKYRKVVPNDYGLSVEEILAADDKELNRWCSLKKAIKIKPMENEKYDLQAYRKKGANLKLKQKIFSSLFSNSTDEGEIEVPKKKAKKIADDSSKLNQDQDNAGWKSSNSALPMKEEMDEEVETNIENDVEPTAHEINAGSEERKKRKKKRTGLTQEVTDTKEEKFGKGKQNLRKRSNKAKKRRKGQPSVKNDYFSGITKSRLKAYGINPKKFQNKLKYKSSK